MAIVDGTMAQVRSIQASARATGADQRGNRAGDLDCLGARITASTHDRIRSEFSKAGLTFGEDNPSPTIGQAHAGNLQRQKNSAKDFQTPGDRTAGASDAVSGASRVRSTTPAAPKAVAPATDPAPAPASAPQSVPASVDVSADSRAVLDALAAGQAGPDVRERLAAVLGPADAAQTHAFMEEVRTAGLLEQFLDAAAVDEAGAPVSGGLRADAREVFTNGKMDYLADAFARTPIKLVNAGVNSYSGGVVSVNRDQGPDVLAHEMFHAYADYHGGLAGASAINEGFAIAATKTGLRGEQANLAETIYGTKNYYRDVGIAGFDPNTYSFGDASTADPELLDVMRTIAASDVSGLAWHDPAQMQDEYQRFFAPLNRDQPFENWLREVDGAVAVMKASRG